VSCVSRGRTGRRVWGERSFPATELAGKRKVFESLPHAIRGGYFLRGNLDGGGSRASSGAPHPPPAAQKEKRGLPKKGHKQITDSRAFDSKEYKMGKKECYPSLTKWSRSIMYIREVAKGFLFYCTEKTFLAGCQICRGKGHLGKKDNLTRSGKSRESQEPVTGAQGLM